MFHDHSLRSPAADLRKTIWFKVCCNFIAWFIWQLTWPRCFQNSDFNSFTANVIYHYYLYINMSFNCAKLFYKWLMYCDIEKNSLPPKNTPQNLCWEPLFWWHTIIKQITLTLSCVTHANCQWVSFHFKALSDNAYSIFHT